MRLLLMLFVTGLLLCGCNNGESNIQKELIRLNSAKWTELSPGVSYIISEKADNNAHDSIHFEMIGVSNKGELVPASDVDKLITTIWDKRLQVLDTMLPAGKSGYIKAGRGAFLALGGFVMTAYFQHHDSALLQSDIEWLRSQAGVANVEYISKEMAKEKFTDDTDTNFSKILDENPLPASFTIKLKERFATESNVTELVNSIRAKLTYIDDLDYPRAMWQPDNDGIKNFYRFYRR